MPTMPLAPKTGEARLEDVHLRDVMTPNPASLPLGTTVCEAGVFLADVGVAAVLVTDEGGRAIGVLSRSDVLKAVGAGADGVPVGEVMSPAVIAVRPDADALQAFTIMARCAIGRVFVADEDGTPVGVVSATDLLRALAARWTEQDAGTESF
jgi:DNA polymerase-3 subunit epsilon/CBS domain-containing protein